VLQVATQTTTFRLDPPTRRRLDRLADELVCSRSDVLRYGMAALREDAELRRQIAADNLARAFLDSLRTHYGEDAVIELCDGPDDPGWRLAGEPIDREILDVVVKRQGDRFVIDLVDKANNIAIRNAASWTDEEGHRHAVVPLRDLWVYSSRATLSEPKTRRLYDGRTVVQIAEDDGPPRHLAIDNEGNARPLSDNDVPASAFPTTKASVGIGVRRESELGPHLGEGFGGKHVLTGDVEHDRGAVVGILEQLVRQAKRGDFDEILAIPTASPDRPKRRR
jgi:predicted transcriptional regulator